MPVQTQCRPFQYQLSVAVGSQPQKVMGTPTVLLTLNMRASHFPRGLFWVVETQKLWVAAWCVCTTWRGGVFTKGWTSKPSHRGSIFPMSTPASENKLLLSDRNLGWISLLGGTTASPFPLTLMRWRWPITGSSWCPRLEGTMQSVSVGWYMRWAGVWEQEELPPWLNREPRVFHFSGLHPISSSHLAFLPGAASELQPRGYENIHRTERQRKGTGCSSGFLVLPFHTWQSYPK